VSNIINNPLTPTRPQVSAIAGLSKPAREYTFREAVEWHKNIVRKWEEIGLGEASAAEAKILETSWLHLMEGIAEREGIPTTFLSYMFHTLAESELRMAQTAEAEYEAATGELGEATKAMKQETEE
jgi:hypothetical protein